jgi:hypothetical protein
MLSQVSLRTDSLPFHKGQNREVSPFTILTNSRARIPKITRPVHLGLKTTASLCPAFTGARECLTSLLGKLKLLVQVAKRAVLFGVAAEVLHDSLVDSLTIGALWRMLSNE